MSKSSEAAALKAYPSTYTTVKRHAKRVQSELVDTHKPVRAIFQQGYEQAEKDHALTWEDIKMIYEIFDALDNEHHSTFNMGIQQYFQEALRRFNEWREKK